LLGGIGGRRGIAARRVLTKSGAVWEEKKGNIPFISKISRKRMYTHILRPGNLKGKYRGKSKMHSRERKISHTTGKELQKKFEKNLGGVRRASGAAIIFF